MPLPPLVPANTCRLYVDYKANGREHTVQFRYGGIEGAGPPPTAFLAGVSDFLNACEAFMPTDWQSLGARYSEVGSNVSLPITPLSFGPGVIGVWAGEAPAFVSFVGRSSGGRRTRVTLLGAGLAPGDEGGVTSDYRATVAESGAIATARTQLIAAGVQAVDGLPVTWYAYANLGYNAYWQRAVRS